MKIKLLTFLLLSIAVNSAISQKDKYNNPVFNSENLFNESFNGYDITGLYYNIKNNITNDVSSVFVSKNPSLNDYIEFATGLPPYAFIVSVNRSIKFIISSVQTNGKFTFLILNSSGGKEKEIFTKISGDISENRANELLQINADNNSKITDNDDGKYLFFNEKSYKIIPFEKIKTSAIDITKELMKAEKIEVPLEFIKKESVGGGLDYEKSLDKSKLYEFNDILYSQPEAAIYLWAKGVKILGVESESEAIKLFEEIYKKTLEGGMKKAFVAGYNSK